MRFKTDENVPSDAVALLRAAGYDVATVPDQLPGGHPDPEIAAVCQSEGRILIVLRLARQSVPEVLRLLDRLLEVFKTDNCDGQLWIVEPDRIRARG